MSEQWNHTKCQTSQEEAMKILLLGVAVVVSVLVITGVGSQDMFLHIP